MQVNSFFEKYILFGFYVLYNIFRVQKFPRFCHESMSFLINIFFSYSSKYDRHRIERNCDSPRTTNSHPRGYHGGRRSPTSPKASPTLSSGSSATGKRYKPSTQAISPPRDSFSEGEANYNRPDLRDSLNRNKNNRGYQNHHRGSSSSLERIKDPRGRPGRLNELRDLVSPASSGDEKDSSFIRKSKMAPTAPDSGLSEDHGSTGSSGSSGTNLTDQPHHHSGYRKNHFKSNSDKIRRSSTDSARSSNHHDDLDLIYKPSGSGVVAGADDVSDGSRPGTPLCDERPENSGSGNSNPVNQRLPVRSSEPMSLPLPKFAHQMLANQIHNQTSSYLTVTKRDKDPRLKSPSTGPNVTSRLDSALAGSNSALMNSLSVSTCLKSPPPSLKSPGASLNNSSRIIPEHDSSGIESSISQIGTKPHDPRLGTKKAPVPHAPVVLQQSSSLMMNDIEDISDSDREDETPVKAKQQQQPSNESSSSTTTSSSVTNVSNTPASSSIGNNSNSKQQQPSLIVTAQDPSKMTLEERLRALDEKYEKWSGSATRVACSSASTPVGSAPATPANNSGNNASLPNLNLPNGPQIQSSESSATSTALSSTSGASTGSTSGGKFNFDLKPTQPSPIVQRLLSRYGFT